MAKKKVIKKYAKDSSPGSSMLGGVAGPLLSGGGFSDVLRSLTEGGMLSNFFPKSKKNKLVKKVTIKK